LHQHGSDLRSPDLDQILIRPINCRSIQTRCTNVFSDQIS